MEAILQGVHLSRSYAGEDSRVPAVDDVSFAVGKREMVGLVGLSGSGKSTLLRLAAGLERPDAGSVKLGFPDDGQKYRRLQMVFQHPEEVFSPRMTIGTFLREPLRNFHRMKREAAGQRIRRFLQEAGMEAEVLDRFPHEVSGGQLQRIVILRALLLEPELILFDEPTSALDVMTQQSLLHFIQSEQEVHPFAGLFVSHDLAVVQQVTDRVLIMEKGKIVEELPSAKLREGTHPCTRRLLAAQLPRDGRPAVMGE